MLRSRRVVHGLGLLALPFAAWLVCGRPAVHADPAKRDNLKREINALLSDMASELRDVPGDSSTSDLERTIDYAGRVNEKARDLKYEAEDDSEARRMADTYPDIASRYRDHARYLREMKADQRKLDDQARRCDDTTRELTSRLRAYTDGGDPRGLDEIPRLTRELARVGKDVLTLAEQVSRDQAGRYDRVDDFSDSDGRWSDVRTNLLVAGRAILDVAYRQQEQLKRDDVCGNLAKEERNPLVEDAMRKLLDGKKGIELLYEAMDRQLMEIAGYLDRLDGDSSDGDIGYAESKLGELERNLDQLDRIRGNDGEARRRVETWRNIARAAREAWKQLRVLKQSQFLADRAPEKCRESGERLRELIRGYVDKSDPKGVKEIPLRARGVAEPIKAGLAKTDEQHGVMERALSDALRFDPSEGRWREVTEKHKASSSAIWEYWKKARDAAHASCDELARGDEAREVKDAVQKLSSDESTANERAQRRVGELNGRWTTLQSQYQETERVVWAHINTSRKLRKFDTDELNQLIVYMCGQDQERDGDEADRLSQDMASRVVSAVRGRKDEYVKSADEAQARLETTYRELRSLQGDGEAGLKEYEAINAVDKNLLNPLREMIKAVAELREKDRSKLFGMLNSDRQAFLNASDELLLGQSNPRVAAANKYGRAKHRELQRDSTFKCAEVEFAAGGGFADCVSHEQCTVWEFKPSSWSTSDAEGQARKYVSDVERAFSKENAAGKPWEKCWQSDGPSRGRGFEAKGYLYPKCD